MSNDRRKSDRVNKYTDRLSKIAYGIGIAFILYIVWPIRQDIKELRFDFKQDIKELKQEQKGQLTKVYEFSQQSKEEINKLRQEYQNDLINFKDNIKKEIDDLIAWIKENGKIL